MALTCSRGGRGDRVVQGRYGREIRVANQGRLYLEFLCLAPPPSLLLPFFPFFFLSILLLLPLTPFV